MSLPAAALQFPLAHPAVAAVIPGPRDVAEFEANLKLLPHPIPLRYGRICGPRNCCTRTRRARADNSADIRPSGELIPLFGRKIPLFGRAAEFARNCRYFKGLLVATRTSIDGKTAVLL